MFVSSLYLLSIYILRYLIYKLNLRYKYTFNKHFSSTVKYACIP